MPGAGSLTDQAAVFWKICFFLLCARALPFRAQRSHPRAVRAARISRVKAVLAGEVLVQHRQVHGASRCAQAGMDVTDPESS